MQYIEGHYQFSLVTVSVLAAIFAAYVAMDICKSVDALHKNGQIIPIDLVVSDVGEKHEHQFIGVMRDISVRKAETERLTYLANHDQLTGLYNRSSLEEQLRHAILIAKRLKTTVVVMFLDLDGFKAVNDNHGHDAGDDLLITIATLLQKVICDSDSVARLGGDEFCIVLDGVPDVSGVEALGKKILSGIADEAMYIAKNNGKNQYHFYDQQNNT